MRKHIPHTKKSENKSHQFTIARLILIMIKYVILKIFDKTAFPHPIHSAMGTGCHTTAPMYMTM